MSGAVSTASRTSETRSALINLVVAIIAGLVVAWAGNFSPNFYAEKTSTLIYDAFATPIRSQFLVKELETNSELWSVRDNLVVFNLENVSDHEANGIIQIRTVGDAAMAYTSYSSDHFFESQNDLESISSDVWNLNLRAFRPGERVRVMIVGERDLDFDSVTTSSNKIRLIDGDASFYEAVKSRIWKDRMFGFLTFIPFMVCAIFLYRFVIRLVPLSLAWTNRAND
ncbi:hypothetical protein AAG593_08370 [Citromicrobium bathyomarinum]